MTEVYLARGEDGKTASRRAMAAALEAWGMPKEPEMAKTVLGKPYLAHYPGVHFNLSHSGSWGACALSEAPVGVDVELVRPLRQNVAGRFFTPTEQAFLARQSEPERAFFRLWTRKESFIKALGKGLTLPLNSFSVLENVMYRDGLVWYFHTYSMEGGYLTLCCQQPEAEFHRVEDAGQ